MKKLPPVAMAVSWMIFCSASLLRAEGPDAMPSPQAPAIIHTPRNYDEMVANIEETGLKVKIDPQLGKFMQTAGCSWPANSWDRGNGPTALTLGNFLDMETLDARLHWELDKSLTVTLTPAWRRDDDRSAGELLKALRTAYADLQKAPRKKDDNYSDTGLAARKPCGLLFNALISKNTNYEKSWRTRMFSLLAPDCDGSWMVDSPDIIIGGDFTDTGGRERILVVLRHTPGLLPGHGGFSYYYFTPEGALVCSGLLSSGGDCFVTSASVKNRGKGGPSELAVKIHSVGYSEDVVQKFVMEPAGLRHTALIRANGAVLTGEGMKDFPTVELVGRDIAAGK